MAPSRSGLGAYESKPASLAKHAILAKYLEQLLFKVGHGYSVLNYIDGFAGPWRSGTEDFSDTSPFIAVNTLLRVRNDLQRERGREVSVRGAFVEKNSEAFHDLQCLLEKYPDVETLVRRGELDVHVPEILDFVKRAADCFTFIFLDPTGWKDVVPTAIRPLLEVQPGEVLINLMTSFIRRFLADPKKQDTIRRLVSEEVFQAAVRGSNDPVVDYRLVEGYCSLIEKLGGYKYVVPAPVLDPRSSKIEYYLVYASRSRHGLEVFREVECKAISQQDWAKATYSEDQRYRRSGQESLFPLVETTTAGDAARMHRFYMDECRQRVGALLMQEKELPYETVLHEGLRVPMTRRKTVTDALTAWRGEGKIDISGLTGRKVVPEYGKGHKIIWLNDVLQ